MLLHHQAGMKHASKLAAATHGVTVPLRADAQSVKQQQLWQAGCQLLAFQQDRACPCRRGPSLASCRVGGPLTSLWQGTLCASPAKGWVSLSHPKKLEFCTAKASITQHAPLM